MAQWQPVQAAAKDASGNYVALINGQWVPVSGAAKNEQGQYMAVMDAQEQSQPAQEQPSLASRIAAPFYRATEAPFGVAEAGLGLVTGMGASAYGGLMGLGELATGGGVEGATKAIEEATQEYTYQPRLATGKKALEYASMPIEYASKGAGYVGGAAGGMLGGEQGRIAGESLGETSVPVAATLFGGAGALKGVRGVKTSDIVSPVFSNIPLASKFVGGIRDVAKTRSEAGKQALAAEYLQKLTTPEEAPKIVSALERRGGEVVPESPVTSAEAIARANREAMLKGKPERFGGQYVALQEGLSAIPETTGELTTVKILQEKARADVLNKGAGTDIEYKAQQELRAKNAARNYKAIDNFLVKADKEIGSLMLRPSMDKAIARAEQLAKEKGDTFQIGKDIPEQTISSSILDASGKPAIETVIPAKPAIYPVKSLQYIKMALDDMIKNPDAFGITGAEIGAIGETRGQFIKWTENKAPLYAKANAAYAIDSLPLNQMDLWRSMRDKFIAPTGKESPGTYLKALRDEEKLIKKATGFTRVGEITDIFNKEQSALANRLAAEMEMELLKKRMAGEVNITGVGKAAEGLEPQLPNMLMRETMAANFLLRLLAKDANVGVNIAAAKILKDPKQLASVLKQVKSRHRPQVLKTIKNAATSKEGSAMALGTAQEGTE